MKNLAKTLYQFYVVKVLTYFRRIIMGRREYWIGVRHHPGEPLIFYTDREKAMYDLKFFNLKEIVHVVEINSVH